jgi:hypothetical protein
LRMQRFKEGDNVEFVVDRKIAGGRKCLHGSNQGGAASGKSPARRGP